MGNFSRSTREVTLVDALTQKIIDVFDGVILEDESLLIDKRLSAKKLKIEKSFIEEISSYSSDFIPNYKALLSETAVNVITDNKIILLSHYGL